MYPTYRSPVCLQLDNKYGGTNQTIQIRKSAGMICQGQAHVRYIAAQDLKSTGRIIEFDDRRYTFLIGI